MNALQSRLERYRERAARYGKPSWRDCRYKTLTPSYGRRSDSPGVFWADSVNTFPGRYLGDWSELFPRLGREASGYYAVLARCLP